MRGGGEGGLRDVEIGITADCGSVLCSVAGMVCVTVQCCRVGCEVCTSCGVGITVDGGMVGVQL